MLCYSCSVSFKPENFDQLREGNFPARAIVYLPARDIAPLPERVWFNLSTGCPREPFPLCFWVTVFNIFTLWSDHAIQMKTDIKRNATSTQSLLTEQ